MIFCQAPRRVNLVGWLHVLNPREREKGDREMLLATVPWAYLRCALCANQYGPDVCLRESINVPHKCGPRRNQLTLRRRSPATTLSNCFIWNGDEFTWENTGIYVINCYTRELISNHLTFIALLVALSDPRVTIQLISTSHYMVIKCLDPDSN